MSSFNCFQAGELARDAEPRCETWARDALDLSTPRDPTPEQAHALIAALLSAVDQRPPPRPRHPASRRMCAYLDGAEHVDLASLSHDAGLSLRQMRHTFARDVGLAMRAYLRWKRLRRATTAVQEGASLSAAAASAGFADSAHLSRVFRDQFGMTPTQGLSSVSWRTLDCALERNGGSASAWDGKRSTWYSHTSLALSAADLDRNDFELLQLGRSGLPEPDCKSNTVVCESLGQTGHQFHDQWELRISEAIVSRQNIPPEYSFPQFHGRIRIAIQRIANVLEPRLIQPLGYHFIVSGQL